MTQVIADSGFFIGLFDPSDAHHERCKRFLAGFRGTFITAWAVFTEVSVQLPHHRLRAFFAWAAQAQQSKHLRIESPPGDAIMALWQSMDKYEDLPMDFCDASLVWLAVHLRIDSIATVDRRDFLVYRLPGNKAFKLVLDRAKAA